MKKTLLLSLLLAGAFVVFPVSDTKAAEKPGLTATASQVQWPQNRGKGWKKGKWGRDKVYYTTRTVRRGRWLYRETYQVRIHNGRTTTRLVSRTRILR
jgi:hypothetical protein